MQLTIGFSPCPNDTFIFDALVNNKIDTQGISFLPIIEDVESLNIRAAKAELDITKLSFHTFLHVASQYALLHSGSALGKGVGPLLVSTEKAVSNWQNPSWLGQATIAIPGLNTTANLLLSLAFPQAVHKVELPFNEIEAAVLSGTYDAGLIIHESRFTYEQKGLEKLIDLGDWWEQQEHALIPLGGIVVNRAIDSKLAATIDSLIKQSLDYSWNNYPQLSEFVTSHAQEMEEGVMRKHIELYVNEYTNNLGPEGTAAVKQLFNKAISTGLIPALPASIFY